MDGFELNKIAAAILIAGIVMMVTGKIAGVLYHPQHAEKRGYALDESAISSASESGTAAPAAETPIDIKPMLASANVAAGQKIFNKCTACHNIDKGGPNKVGPNLWSILGGQVAAKGDFTYSKALKEKGGSWTYDSLAQFLKHPGVTVKGTKMTFAGIKNDQDLANLVAYLRTQCDNPLPLP